MKPALRQSEICIIVIACLLAGCSRAPQDEGVLPTLAVLPSLTPTVRTAAEPTAASQASETPAQPATETPVTPNPIVLPSQLELNPTPTSINDLGFDVYPDVLELGAELTLRGVLTSEDLDSGQAVLTNENDQQVLLLVDPFTATMGNNQFVQITGIVEQSPASGENAIRVSAINMLDAELSQPNGVEPLIEAQVTPDAAPP